MTCEKFRFVVAIVASLAGFMAYQARYNLSLSIEKMIYTEGNGGGFDLSSELDELGRGWSEDEVIAQLSVLTRYSNSRNERRLKIPSGNSNRSTSPVSRFGDSLGALTLDVKANIEGNTESPIADNELPASSEPTVESTVEENLLHWSSFQKDAILGSFFLGYVIFQIPVGLAASRFGAKPMFMFLGLGTALTTLLFPYACLLYKGNIVLAYIDRFVMGICQACLFPAAYLLLCQWLPKSERSKWLPITGTSSRIGMIFMNFIVPIIQETYSWQMVFYVSGCLTLIWVLIFTVLASSSPATSRWISPRERMYIESAMEPRQTSSSRSLAKLTSFQSRVGSVATLNQQLVDEEEKLPPMSWSKLLTNRPMIILACVMFTSEWSNLLLLIKLPGFLGSALNMELSQIGFWSATLNVLFCVWFPFTGYLASRLEDAQIDGLSSCRIRKIFELTAHSLQAAACLLIAFFPNKTIVISALIMLMLGRSTVGGGQCLMPPELTKDYPGNLVALTNSIANLAGIVGPYVVNILVEDTKSYESWRPVWLLSAAIFLAGGAIFALLAQNKPQDYSKTSKSRHGHPSADEEIIKMDAYARVMMTPSGPKFKR